MVSPGGDGRCPARQDHDIDGSEGLTRSNVFERRGETVAAQSSLLYCNPVLDRYLADPFVFRSGDHYYLVGTSSAETGLFPMMRSANLVEWEPLGACLDAPSQLQGSDFWAPEVAFDGRRFYMYYSVGFGDAGHRLRTAVADNPGGPYVDLGIDLVDAERTTFAIDPSPFQDVDGQWYLFYARDFLLSEGNERPGTALVVDRLDSMTRLAGDERTVLRATQDWQRFMSDRPIYGATYDWHTLEGPCTVRRGDKYYCFYSGGCWKDDTYGVDYAEADHPMGPWRGGRDAAPRVLRTVAGKVIGPGHNSVVRARDGITDYIAYHAWDAERTVRRTCLDKLIWSDDGPRCLGPTWTPQPL